MPLWVVFFLNDATMRHSGRGMGDWVGGLVALLMLKRVQNNSKVLFEKFQIWELRNVSAMGRRLICRL